MTKPPTIPTAKFGFKEKIPKWMEKVSPRGDEEQKVKAALGVAYSTLADKIQSGELDSVAKAAEAAKQVRKEVYRIAGRLLTNWDEFDKALAADFSALGASGDLTTLADTEAAFRELSDEFSGDRQFLSPEFLELIIKLVLQIIAALGN